MRPDAELGDAADDGCGDEEGTSDPQHTVFGFCISVCCYGLAAAELCRQIGELLTSFLGKCNIPVLANVINAKVSLFVMHLHLNYLTHTQANFAYTLSGTQNRTYIG